MDKASIKKKQQQKYTRPESFPKPRRNPKEEIDELCDVISSNPAFNAEEAILLIRELGEIYEPRQPLGEPIDPRTESKPTLKGYLLNYLYDIKEYSQKNKFIKPFIEPVKKITNIVINFASECGSKIKDFRQKCSEDYKTYLVNSSKLIQQIEQGKLAIKSLEEEQNYLVSYIETLIEEAINDIDENTQLNMQKILSDNYEDKTSIAYFAIQKPDDVGQNGMVNTVVQNLYNVHKKMSGSSRSSEMPRILSQFDVIKNIISIFYTRKEDFTEFDEKFSNVGFVGFTDLYNDNLDDKNKRKDIDPIAIEAFGVLEDYLKNKVNPSEHETAYEAPKEETDEDLENYKDFGDRLLKAIPTLPHATYGDPTRSNKEVKEMKEQLKKGILSGMYDSSDDEMNGGKKSKKTKKTKKIKKSKKTKKVRKNRKNKQSKRRQKR
jgi:hypothetical protein